MFVIPDWFHDLPLQQQSVLLLATRGPDGIPKYHVCKDLIRAYRASVLLAAKFGRQLQWGERTGERGDSFMCLEHFANDYAWKICVDNYLSVVDEIPHHYHLHLMHGAEILGYKHPDARFRARWQQFYAKCVQDMHLSIEMPEDMDGRLGDWERRHWDRQEGAVNGEKEG